MAKKVEEQFDKILGRKVGQFYTNPKPKETASSVYNNNNRISELSSRMRIFAPSKNNWIKKRDSNS